MRRINIRQWMVILLSGFLQYPVTGVMNPFGIAYFGAAYMWPEHRNLLPVVTLLWNGGGDSPDHASKISWNTYRCDVHNLYTGMEKGLGQPA